MKKITKEFLKDVIKRNTETSEVRDASTGGRVKKEFVNVEKIVDEVMTALRSKRKKKAGKKNGKTKKRKRTKKGN